MKKQNKNKRKTITRGVGIPSAKMLLVAVLSASLILSAVLMNPLTASAEGYIEKSDAGIAALSIEEYTEGRAGKLNYNLPGTPSTNLSYYAQKTITVRGKQLSEPAAVINGMIYLPLRAFASAATNATYSYSGGVSTVRASGLVLTAATGGYVVYANDRPLFSFSPTVRMKNGSVYIPAAALERAFGLKRSSESTRAISFSGSYSPLLPASRYYKDDEVYWLSKIISAESSGESLLGQIAVGDVILNRVKSPSFPNTIYGVIFDRKWGVQFSPTADGRIYNSPTYSATLAAKICLEGTSLSDNAIYFLNPRAASSNWIVKNRNYLYTIGNHDFYD